MEQVFLTKRNLLILLSKLDRQEAGETTACTIIKRDNKHPKYSQTMEEILVTAVRDEDYYTDRPAGFMHPKDEMTIAIKKAKK